MPLHWTGSCPFPDKVNIIPHVIVTTLGDGDYAVNHRRVHLGPYLFPQIMWRNNGHTITSATYRHMTAIMSWIHECVRIIIEGRV